MQEILSYVPPVKPLLQLFVGLCVGLFLASFLEALNVTKKIAVLTRPFVKYAHLSDISAGSFALALFSPASANALLGEALQNKKLTEKEVIVSNLFNSLPSTLTHIPTFFFMSFPILGKAAVIYTAISVVTAVFRTLATVLAGRFLLPVPKPPCMTQNTDGNFANSNFTGTADKNSAEHSCTETEEKPQKTEETKTFWQNALGIGWKRFVKRLPRLLFIGIPVYCLMFYLQRFGFFKYVEKFLVSSLGFDFLKPEAMSIIVLYMAAELRASLIAGGTVYQAGLISADEVVLALLIGNVLSTPMRGIRHQLPAYASYYPAGFAVKLLACNQISRCLSMALVAVLFYVFFF